jgi:hypothetical protein
MYEVKNSVKSLEDIKTSNNSSLTKPNLEGNRKVKPRKISELGISPKGRKLLKKSENSIKIKPKMIEFFKAKFEDRSALPGSKQGSIYHSNFPPRILKSFSVPANRNEFENGG